MHLAKESRDGLIELAAVGIVTLIVAGRELCVKSKKSTAELFVKETDVKSGSSKTLHGQKRFFG